MQEFLRHYPYTFELDGEPVTVHIKRMNFQEAQEFYLRVAELEETVYAKQFYRREGVEQETNGNGEYKMSFEDLCQRRIAEMSAEEQTEIRSAEKERIKEQNEFLGECIRRFVVHVEPGLVDIHADGSKHPVTNGDELLEVLGARRDVVLKLYAAIFAENRMTAEQKKIWKSPAGSFTSSKEQKKDQDGQKQRTTVASAENEGSAENVDA